jgi:KUP system potassium uptake protein
MWRERLFARLARNARRATKYFHLPSESVMELGTEIEL